MHVPGHAAPFLAYNKNRGVVPAAHAWLFFKVEALTGQ